MPNAQYLFDCACFVAFVSIMGATFGVIDFINNTDPFVTATCAGLVAVLICVARALWRAAEYALGE